MVDNCCFPIVLIQWFVVAAFRASMPCHLDEDAPCLPYLRSVDTHALQNLPPAQDASDQVQLEWYNAIRFPAPVF